MSADLLLSKPVGRDPIDPATLGYMRQRNRGRLYNVVIDEFERSGLSQVDIAGRLHKGTDQISRWLGSPGNWTVDTVSDLFFAITGGEISYATHLPLDLPATNMIAPDWMTIPAPITSCAIYPSSGFIGIMTGTTINYTDIFTTRGGVFSAVTNGTSSDLSTAYAGANIVYYDNYSVVK